MNKLVLLIPFLIFISPIIIAYCLYQHLWMLTILYITIVIYVNVISECFALNFVGLKNNKKGEKNFRILTYNLNRAYSNIKYSKENINELLSIFILNQNADIVLLQEYDIQIYPIINEILKKEYPYGISVSEIDSFKVLYSKYPIKDYRQLFDNNKNIGARRLSENQSLPVCFMRFDLNGKDLVVVNCHLQSNQYSKALCNYRYDRNIKRLVINTWKYLDENYLIRIQQARIIKDEIIKLNFPLIICGDFNDIGGSKTIRIMKGGIMRDAWWEKGFGFGFTFKSLGLRLRLDHILFNRSLSALSVTIPQVKFSDHLPLIADFRFEQ